LAPYSFRIDQKNSRRIPFKRVVGGPRTLEPAEKDLVDVNELVFDDELRL
jgi:hypothetical protein